MSARRIIEKEFDRVALLEDAKSCELFETAGQYDAYMQGLDFALDSVKRVPNIKKADTYIKIINMLNEWADAVEDLGNECAATDRIIDDLPALAEQLTKIGD